MCGKVRVNLAILILLGISHCNCLGVNEKAGSVLVDGTAALVGKTLITVQDAYLYRSLQRIREGQNDIFEPESKEAMHKTVQKIALQYMVSAEMKSLKLDDKTSKIAIGQEASGLIKSMQRRLGDALWEQFLKRFGKSQAAIVEELANSLSVEHFLEKKIETLTPVITESEAQGYYQENQPRFKAESFAELKEGIVRLLRKQRMEKALEDWVRFLKQKYGFTQFI